MFIFRVATLSGISGMSRIFRNLRNFAKKSGSGDIPYLMFFNVKKIVEFKINA